MEAHLKQSENLMAASSYTLIKNKERGIKMEKTLRKQTTYVLSSLAALIAVAATFAAQTSSWSCGAWIFGQPKMPESLIQKD
jgi:cyclic lactone autoinducer peptide